MSVCAAAPAASAGPPPGAPLRVVFLAPYVPSSLRPRPLGFLRGLAARGHRVTLVAAATSAGEVEEARALAGWCERVVAVPTPRWRSLLACLRGLAGPAPLQARYCQSPALARALGDALGGPAGPPDLLHVEHLRAAAAALPLAGLPRVLDAVDCITRLLDLAAAHAASRASRLVARLERGRTARFEGLLARRFDHVLVASAADAAALAGLAAAPGAPGPGPGPPVSVLPHGVDLERFAPAAGGRPPASLVFVGRMGYHANVTAAAWLVGEVMPRVWARRPDATLALVGPDPPAGLRARAARAPGPVTVTGRVPDVRPWLAGATLAVAPLVYAVGVQNKLLEALATATPVVTTPEGAAGLGARPGEDLVVASGAPALAAAVVDLLGDAAARARLGRSGRRWVERHHDPRAAAAALEAVYREAIARHRAGAGRPR
jgi:glycosyltransferase involved in cell wall biosynthesis